MGDYAGKKIAIVLSGCGNKDGSELQETLSLMLAIDRNDMVYQCFAPDCELEVVSHLADVPSNGERRNVIVESARVARGNIMPLSRYRPEDYAALAFPGGMGAARNLSTYASDGSAMTVLPEVQHAIVMTHAAKKPIMAMCIAPVLLAKVLGPQKVVITLGNDLRQFTAAQMMGASCIVCQATEVCVDERNLVLTTPAYMAAGRISEIFDGASNMVKKLLEWL